MFNEDSRVKIPAILHLCRLGYEYLSLKNQQWDEATNIFPDIFKESIARINPGLEAAEIVRTKTDLTILLDNEDLGKAFYHRLVTRSGVKLIDFDNFDRNSFHVVTELTCKNGEDEFRPDITLLINGMPLAFIEVKKPNNKDGILAERERINRRFQNKKFRKFVNITQLMVFSNNMPYSTDDPEPLQGAFYATTSYTNPIFNYFREDQENPLNVAKILRPEDDVIENFVLKDTNLQIIKHSPEFLENKNPDKPTNSILSSLFSRERLAFLLQYSIVYVLETNGLEKHVMRYPQLFATKAIEAKLEKGERKGIVWHTQGSGKTALAYYNVKYLTDYFQRQDIVPKFYFIVDRLDLLKQAKREFSARDLVVHTVDSKEEFQKDLRTTTALHNHSGKPEITVVNIQKFENDPEVVRRQDYNVDIQRIYFLDEVHRSYNPKGSFLANLTQSDTNAIKIGLTGTPLLGDDFNSKSLFGGYFHKYYYNMSIADGYTLRLIREEIATNYKMALEKVLKEIEVLQKDIPREKIYAHRKFVEPMLDYIVEDFERFRGHDPTIGGMVVCDSSDQARMLFEVFNERYDNRIYHLSAEQEFALAAQPHEPDESPTPYTRWQNDRKAVRSAALILHDSAPKDELDRHTQDFKDGKIDFLFVYNMLLTGFDAKRLKKLYLGRVIRRHNLLQTLTRVNRPYKAHRYGYVVDFADIRKEFDATNKAYFDELQAELGDEMEHYSNLFKSKEEIEAEILELKEVLFQFDTLNKENFSSQVTEVTDRKTMLEIVKALDNIKSLHNMIRLFGHYDLLDKIDFNNFNELYKVANSRLQLLNAREALENSSDNTNLLNLALEDIIFLFRKVKEEELILADQLKNTLRRTREALGGNFDPADPEWVSLYDALEKLFKKKNLNEITQEDMRANIGALREILAKVNELNRKNRLLQAKYDNDAKYARIHKRIVERGDISKRESQLHEALTDVKNEADLQVMQNQKLLENETYFETMMVRMVIDQFVKKHNIQLNADTSKFVNKLVVKEYKDEFYGRARGRA
jgi:type I restriction enzyme R subunit